MNNTISFARLRNLLMSLGFQETIVPQSHVVYEHSGSGTTLVFRLYQLDERVSWNDVAVARKFLTERGLLDEDEFERLLHEARVA